MTKEEINYRTGATLTNSSSILQGIYDIENLFNFGNQPTLEEVKIKTQWIKDRVEDIRTHQNHIRENFNQNKI